MEPLILTPTQDAFVNSTAVVNTIFSNTGEGKCLGRGTPVLMHDGTIKKVEDIAPVELLMGDDSAPRMVQSLSRGRDQMYEVIPVKGEPFTVNGAHILVLKRTRMTKAGSKHSEDLQCGNIIEITLDDYLKQSPRFKHIHKLFRVPVEFPEASFPFPPYLLGLWLGDGTAVRPEITTADPEIISYLKEAATGMHLRLKMAPQADNASFVCTFTVNGGTEKVNAFSRFLKLSNLYDNKHIPHIYYKANSKKVRLELLAGLIDSDGWFNHEGYQIIQKDPVLAADIAFLARSVGLAAYIKPRIKFIKARNFSATYYHVMISGNCSIIPVKIPRKKCRPRTQKKDVLMTGIKEVRPLGLGDYFGFTIDGNRRFLLGDFTVTHNTWSCILAMLNHAQRCKKAGVDGPIRMAIVRDTHENIKSSIVPSIEKFFRKYYPPVTLKPRNDWKQLKIRNDPPIEVDLFGIDDLASLSRLQGPEYALIWLNEPAPMVSGTVINAGLSVEVFKAALVRCARQEGAPARLQIDMNPADEDHWTYGRLIEPGVIDPRTPLITKAVFHIPYGENPHQDELARQAVIAAYAGDKAGTARYVEGRFAVVQRGPAVTPTYNRARHLSKYIIDPTPGLESFAFFDSWGNPACVLGQITRNNRRVYIDTLRLFGADIEALLELQVIPLLESPKWKGMAKAWRIGGDCTMSNMDQSKKLESAARKVAKAFPGAFLRMGPGNGR